MVTRDGVKILEFDLAKPATAKPGPTEATLTEVLTTEGIVMGRRQSMAPELVEGKEADARADIRAFGAVLYEMLTGRKAFEGKSYSSSVGANLAAGPAVFGEGSGRPLAVDAGYVRAVFHAEAAGDAKHQVPDRDCRGRLPRSFSRFPRTDVCGVSSPTTERPTNFGSAPWTRSRGWDLRSAAVRGTGLDRYESGGSLR